jgi:hypothetical protein
MRLVCKRFSQCLQLPWVELHADKGGKHPFFPSVLACSTAELTFSTYEDIDNAIASLKSASKLRSLKLDLTDSSRLEPMRLVMDYVASPHKALRTLYYSGRFEGVKQLSALADALQRQDSIKELQIVIQRTDKDTDVLMRCIISKKLEKLHWIDASMSLETTKLLANWIASPNCTLVDLNIDSANTVEKSSLIMDAVALNRSLRGLAIRDPFCSETKIMDCVTQQGLIERLNVPLGDICHLGSLLKMLMLLKRLEPHELSVNIDAFTLAEPAEPELLYQYIASPYCFKNGDNFEDSLIPYWHEEALVEAWKRNSTLTSLRIDFMSPSVTCRIQNAIFEHSSTLRHLVLERLDGCFKWNLASSFLKALQSSKQLETLWIGQLYGVYKVDESSLAVFFSGLQSLKSLKTFRVWNHLITSVGPEISAAISNMQCLRVLDLSGSHLTYTVLTSILESASTLKTLEELRLDKIELKSGEYNSHGFDAALRNVLSNNPLETLSLDSVDLKSPTLETILDFLVESTIITLRVLDLTNCNFDPEIRKVLDRFAVSKFGLITIHYHNDKY